MTSNAPTQQRHDLLQRLTSRHGATADAALLDAVSDTEHGEQVLLQALPLVAKTRLPHVLAALGDFPRRGHTDAIRHSADRGGRDARTTALVALARREGAHATPDLLHGLASRDTVVKDYALTCLVVVGDERAWEAVHDRFAYLARRPVGQQGDSWGPGEDLPGRIRRYAPTDLAALVYLISRATPPQGRSLVRQLHRDWTKISTHRPLLLRWLRERWPQVDPDTAAAESIELPDVADELRWYRENPTFAAPSITAEVFGPLPPAPAPALTPAEQQRARAHARLIQAQQQAASTSTSREVLLRLTTTGSTPRVRATAQQRLDTLPVT